jgi:hypothetical protein
LGVDKKTPIFETDCVGLFWKLVRPGQQIKQGAPPCKKMSLST